MGGSYGGYATLAGLTFTPEAFACGVDIVGPSNLFTLLQTIPPYWEAGKQQFYKRMGDPNTEAGKALLTERSPLNFAERIVRPLLIGQGANDPRVNVRESDQIVEAMAAKKIPVTYVLFPDEGHGFARPVNNIAFNAVTENFLAKCLGGRAEGIGDTVKMSTAQIKHGAEFTPGLEQASPSNQASGALRLVSSSRWTFTVSWEHLRATCSARWATRKSPGKSARASTCRPPSARCTRSACWATRPRRRSGSRSTA